MTIVWSILTLSESGKVGNVRKLLTGAISTAGESWHIVDSADLATARPLN